MSALQGNDLHRAILRGKCVKGKCVKGKYWGELFVWANTGYQGRV
ncbi:hypothetical protein SAMN05216379_1304 [Nitrosomonas eutropha]|uniref:Uncharacterized protein n=1 Tax=Nitrosomonas eutropha TaxID=916 RepID=A0ABX5MCH7_9PROT|nr:hypothetical protein C8R14_10593 [Nitrosomonas eutropha]SCX26012.1 hypothetical protein SAMN05216379_1304 [Nitrosomonas eutropha]